MADLKQHSDPSKEKKWVKEDFNKKVAIPSDYAAQYNDNFVYSGFSGVTAQVSQTVDGMKLSPSGFSGSYGCVQPLASTALGTSGFSGYLSAAKQCSYYLRFKTGSSVASHVIYAGLKYSNTDVQATDDDSVYFRFADGYNDNKLVLCVSTSGTDRTYLTDVSIVANTVYEVEVDFDENGKVYAYVNGNSVRPYPIPGPAIGATLFPMQGVKSTDAAVSPTLTLKALIVGRIDD